MLTCSEFVVQCKQSSQISSITRVISMTEPSRTQADNLANTPKFITEQVKWKRGDANRWYLQVTVYAPELEEILDLRGQVGKRNYSFCLLWRNYDIRRYTKHHRHLTPHNEVLCDPHKHYWDPEYKSSDAYIPEDIDPDSCIADQFKDFCRECNIELEGGWVFPLELLRKTP